MQEQLPLTCTNFLAAIKQDLPTIKLFKYRHFLITNQEVALKLFNQMTGYALQKKLIGEYEAIYETVKRDLDRTQQYKQLRQAMIDQTNPIRNQTEHAESISSLEDTVRGYFKLAQYYRQVAMHRQAVNYYNKLFRTQTGNKTVYQRSHYFSAWAQELYFDNDWNGLSIFIRNDLQDPKLIDATLATIKDLKFIELGQSSSKFFENLLSSNFNVNSIISNLIISYEDLGIIYSLVALAKKDRKFLKIKTPWSGKLEVLYLQNQFRQLLQKVQEIYEKQGKFHPLIDKIYGNLVVKIRQRILCKYLQIYHSVTLSQLQHQTSFSEGGLKIFLQKNKHLPYLIDPITQSVIYYPRTVPLEDEAMQYSQTIKDKFRQIVRNCITGKKTEDSTTGQRMFGGGMGGLFSGMMDV